MGEHLPLSRGTLARVYEAPEENEKLKRISRRRRELVEEKVRINNRMQSDIKAICPELLDITRSADNLWFLRFLSSRDDLEKLARMRPESIQRIRGIRKVYMRSILSWQAQATFAPEASYVGPMIISDAKRLLELISQIAAMEKAMRELSETSEIARRLSTIPGFGEVSVAELAGEIGTLERFLSEASLALYLGMCPLCNQSGKFCSRKVPRQVNKRTRMAMMTALSHHILKVPQSRVFYDRKRSEGKRHNQAVPVQFRALGYNAIGLK